MSEFCWLLCELVLRLQILKTALPKQLFWLGMSLSQRFGSSPFGFQFQAWIVPLKIKLSVDIIYKSTLATTKSTKTPATTTSKLPLTSDVVSLLLPFCIMKNADGKTLPWFLCLSWWLGTVTWHFEIFTKIKPKFTTFALSQHSLCICACSKIEFFHVKIVWQVLHHLRLRATLLAFRTIKWL